jgi:hypothetical protein
MALVSQFELFLPLLRRYLSHQPFGDKARLEVETFYASPAFARLPFASENETQVGLALLRAVTEALHHLLEENLDAALNALEPTLRLPLEADPFYGVVYEMGAKLAGTLGREKLLQFFSERYTHYRERYNLVRGLEGSLFLQEVVEVERFLEGDPSEPPQPYDANATYRFDAVTDVRTFMPSFLTGQNYTPVSQTEDARVLEVILITPRISTFTARLTRFSVSQSAGIDMGVVLEPAQQATIVLAQKKIISLRFVMQDESVQDILEEALSVQHAANQLRIRFSLPETWRAGVLNREVLQSFLKTLVLTLGAL